MKITSALTIALIALCGMTVSASAATLSPDSPWLLLRPASRIVGVWEFQVQTFNCTTRVLGASFRASTVFNVGGTLEDTNNRPQAMRGPAFGIWAYDPQAREYVTQSRLYRYNADGSFAGVNQIRRTLKLSHDANRATSELTASILGPNEEVLSVDCATQDGTRSL
ncbi:MAG: hypothetical protein ABJA62_11435 [Luteimonas sp.]